MDFQISESTLEKYTGSDTCVVIPNEVTMIEDFAFGECDSLKRILINGNVGELQRGSFGYSGAIESLTINGDVTAIMENAFESSTGFLKTITIRGDAESIGKGVFRKSGLLESVTIRGDVGEIGDDAFYGCGMLEKLEIRGDVEVIGDSAFYDCYSLSNINIQGDVTTIKDYAFVSCGMTEVRFTRSVASIGSMAFMLCEQLELVELPHYHVNMGATPFESCDELKYLILGTSEPFDLQGRELTSAFYYWMVANDGAQPSPSDLEFCTNGARLVEYNGTGADVVLPRGITVIGSHALSSKDMTAVTIPEGVKYIEECAFAHCENLTEIVLPRTLKKVGDLAFFECKSLAQVVIPDGIEDMQGAFDDCESLKNVSIRYNGMRYNYTLRPGKEFTYQAYLEMVRITKQRAANNGAQ